MVVDFGASWCDHCRGMLPAVVALTEAFPRPLFVLTDVDQVPETAADVRYTPTFAFFHRNRKVRAAGTLCGPVCGAHPRQWAAAAQVTRNIQRVVANRTN